MVHSDSLFQMTSIQNATLSPPSPLTPSIGSLRFKRADMSNDPCHYTHLLPVLSPHSPHFQIHVDHLTPPPSPCSQPLRLTTVDLTGGRNNPLTEVTVPISHPPNGLLFSWTVALYHHHHEYSTRAELVRTEDWEDHWLQAFYALSGLEAAQKEVHLIALMRDTNWRFAACCAKDAAYQKVKMGAFKPLTCSCGFHALLNTGLMSMYQNRGRNEVLENAVQRVQEWSVNNRDGLGHGGG